mgnify:FL=1
METVKQPQFIISYNGKDITSDISSGLLSVEYTANTENLSDEIAITVEDTDANWRGPWYPTKGDTLSLEFGYKGSALISAGNFKLDEIALSGPPDVVSIRGIAAGFNKAVRTRNSKAFENQSLKQIADAVAKNHGFTVQGTIANVQFSRVTQNRENDLEFLRRIASEYGHIFSVRDSKLIFTNVNDIEKGKAVVSIDRTDLLSYSLRDKTSNVFKDAQVKYHDPKDKTVKEYKTSGNTNADGEDVGDTTQEDTLEIRTKAENKGQAEMKAKAALYHHNSRQKEGTLVVSGNPLLVAGNNMELTGMGAVSGKYHITQSRHRITKGSGYTTEVSVKRVGFVEKVKEKPKNVKHKKPKYRVIS